MEDLLGRVFTEGEQPSSHGMNSLLLICISSFITSKYSPSVKKDRKKEDRKWDNSGTSKDMHALDFSEAKNEENDKSDAGKNVSLNVG